MPNKGRKKPYFPQSIDYALVNTAQYAVGLHRCQGTLLMCLAAKRFRPPGTGLRLCLITTELSMNFFAELGT